MTFTSRDSKFKFALARAPGRPGPAASRALMMQLISSPGPPRGPGRRGRPVSAPRRARPARAPGSPLPVRPCPRPWHRACALRAPLPRGRRPAAARGPRPYRRHPAVPAHAPRRPRPQRRSLPPPSWLQPPRSGSRLAPPGSGGRWCGATAGPLAALGPGRPQGGPGGARGGNPGGWGFHANSRCGACGPLWGAWGPLAEGREGALPSKFEPP